MPTRRILLPALALASTLALVSDTALGVDTADIGLAPLVQGVTYGGSVHVDGRLFQSGSGLPQQDVRLEASAYPRLRPFQPALFATSKDDGSFRFSVRPETSVRLRAVSPNPPATSRVVNVYTVPRLRLSYRFSSRSDRLVETLMAFSPRRVRLRGRVFLYLAPFGARRLPFRKTAALRPVRPGVSRMVARFKLPASYGGGFSFRTCYDAPRSTGMDDPRDRCRRRAIRPI
jgi:hypothetical protein